MDDETAVRSCIEGWVKTQRSALSGDEFWDSYTQTRLDSPDLSEYARRMRALIHDREKFERRNGEASAPQQTIHVVKTLNAVRSGEVLNVEWIEFNDDEKAIWRRDRSARAMVRIESSMNDGTPIIRDWPIYLLKENAKWGIYEIVSPL